jgi:hypothetical protein
MLDMETYHGHVRTQLDAILLFEACRLGLLPRIQRRLSERERLQISSGCIYVWDEREAGMRRWTDGKPWSASRVSGSFLTYREMEGTRRLSPETSNEPNKKKMKTNSTSEGSTSPPESTGGEDGYRYKPGGLYKQSFSIITSSNLKLHLISYYTKEDVNSGKLVQPSMDPKFKDIRIPIELYPDTSPSGSNLTPAITTVPLDPHYRQPPPQPQQQAPQVPSMHQVLNHRGHIGQAPPPSLQPQGLGYLHPNPRSPLPAPINLTNFNNITSTTNNNNNNVRRYDMPPPYSEDRRALNMLDKVLSI